VADTPNILTPLQRRFLEVFSQTELKKDFFLTGGTALAHFYLQHRLSDDLDFFTEVPGAVARARPILDSIAVALPASLKIRREYESFLEVFLSTELGAVRCDFALTSPFRLQPVQLADEFGIYIDNLLDIACNKFSALFDRHEAKDFVDVYFLCHEFMSFDDLFTNTQKKHVGLDEYWMARALENVSIVEKLPRLLKPLDLSTLRRFFNEQMARLMKKVEGNS
jgi:predicted nucleotidyltransferase component of viral defense system